MKIGDRVKIIAKVDGFGNSGEVASIDQSRRHPIEVVFNEHVEGVGLYCYYSKSELKLTTKEETKNAKTKNM